MIFKKKDKYPNKIFCVGRNKTGTTSLHKFFESQGFVVGDQRKGELLYKAYLKREFSQIVEFCRTADVFQDFPFSYPKTFYYMDKAFPEAKFILTIRDNPNQWYNSIFNYYSKLFQKGNQLTSNDFKRASYVNRGWMYKIFVEYFCLPDDDVMNKDILINSYLTHNNHVVEYFKNREDKLIVINLSDKEDYGRLCDFLEIEKRMEGFPWENKTDEFSI